jgi:outer membrane biosynthesis protein TonB
VQSAAGAAAELPKTRKATAESTKADRSLPSLRSNAATTENSPAPRNIAAPKVPIIASRDTLDPSRVPAIVAYETLRAPLMPSSFEAMAPAVPSADRASKTELANAIYSRDDSEVQPPVMLYPQMPPPLIVGGPPEGIVNSMELVIAPDGSVERVRLISAPRRMADMMLLSGAKLWRFSPAVKDGKPVRYRTTLSWTVFP